VTQDGWRVEVVTRSPEQTRAVGAAIAGAVAPGDVILLIGELGSGKTTLTKGLVAALGGGESTTSPTFTLCHFYATTPPVAHVDCYRTEPRDDLADLALDEALEDGYVVVVEWGERVRGLLDEGALECVIATTFTAAPERARAEDDETRAIALSSRGAAWSARADALRAGLARAGLEVRRRGVTAGGLNR
jgi:tRNA threonylcarbamoyladenosine biosynthesis protein TsaE